MGEAETPSVSTYPYSFPALYRCLRDGPAALQRSDWAQIFQPCAHPSARRPISLVPWAGCFHLRGGPSVSRGPNRCLY